MNADSISQYGSQEDLVGCRQCIFPEDSGIGQELPSIIQNKIQGSIWTGDRLSATSASVST